MKPDDFNGDDNNRAIVSPEDIPDEPNLPCEGVTHTASINDRAKAFVHDFSEPHFINLDDNCLDCTLETSPQTSQGASMDDVMQFAPADSTWAADYQADPITYGRAVFRNPNRLIAEQMKKPDPKNLWQHIWYEGELCCMFADSNVGKSILAVQISDEVAQLGRVLYFDFELRDKQFQIRYSSNDGTHHVFNDNMKRVKVIRDSGNAIEDDVFRTIEHGINMFGVKCVVIDNLTYLCTAAERGEDARIFMQRMTGLMARYEGLSILIVAHCPKREKSMPLTDDNLAGSKVLFNFFDSVFAIGNSCQGQDMRYVKQLKGRISEVNKDNVLVFKVEKSNAYLHFEPMGVSSEAEHLLPDEKSKARRNYHSRYIKKKDRVVDVQQQEISNLHKANNTETVKNEVQHDKQLDLWQNNEVLQQAKELKQKIQEMTCKGLPINEIAMATELPKHVICLLVNSKDME